MASALIARGLEVLVERQTKSKYAGCTVDTCPISTSFYFYRMDLGANIAFIVLFGLSLLGFVVTLATTRRFWGFHVAMMSGTILEVLGYAGRIMSWQDQWGENGFLMQIVCLTIAPAFMAAGIYLCLRRIVYAFGPENSRIRPESYTRIFIPCDILSLVLQAIGGGIASTATHQGNSPDTGDHVMVAGLAFQVLTLGIFITLCVDFFFRTLARHRSLGESAFDQNPELIKLRHDWRFKAFLGALALATICIFWRSVYRVVELGEGWTGDLIRRQNLFIGFEGVMVIVACVALNLFNPALCFKEGHHIGGGLGAGRKAKKQARLAEKEGRRTGETSIVGSDVDKNEPLRSAPGSAPSTAV